MKELVQTLGGLFMIIFLISLAMSLLNFIWFDFNIIYLKISATSFLGVCICYTIDKTLE